MRRIRFWSWCPACDWALSWSDGDRSLAKVFDEHDALGGDHRAYVETQAERVARLEQYAFVTWLRLRILQVHVYKYQLPAFLWINER
jgi:hypothetical protein